MSWWLFLLAMLFTFYIGLRVGGTLVKDYYEQLLKEIEDRIDKILEENAVPELHKQRDSESVD